jgi:hypothetical protein
MRKLGLKLGLSCAALAACATTLVSTTFAWYTSNDTVKANGVTGKTSEQDATLLLISKTGDVGSWGATVSIDSSKVTLEPVAYASTKVKTNNTALEAGKYYGWDATGNKESGEVTGGLTSTDKYISFYLYFKSGSSADLTVGIKSFTLANKAEKVADLPTKSVLAKGTGATDATYYVDMLLATNVVMTVEQGKEVAKDAASPVVTAAGTRTAYAADSAALGTNTGNDANAHTYYNNVKGTSIVTNIETSEDEIGTVETLQTGKFTFSKSTGAGAAQDGLDNLLMVKFDIYLDGWDKMCFDAVRQQSFTLDMEFTGIDPTQQQGGNNQQGGN